MSALGGCSGNCSERIFAPFCRHVYYVGGPTCGMVGIVDASEMVDTYGADVDEVLGAQLLFRR